MFDCILYEWIGERNEDELKLKWMNHEVTVYSDVIKWKLKTYCMTFKERRSSKNTTIRQTNQGTTVGTLATTHHPTHSQLDQL